MSDFTVSDVVEEKGKFRTKYVVTVYFDQRKSMLFKKVHSKSKKFSRREDAVAYQKKMLAQRDRERQKRKREAEKERERAEYEAKEKRLRAEYDKDPEYFVTPISPPLKIKNHPYIAKVDVNAFAREIGDVCYKMSQNKYQVVAVTPLISTIGRSRGSRYGTYGFGLNFTDGVVVVARKVPADSSIQPADNPPN